ncbi:MAG: DUF1214 domain-containing protein [bacterium]|nr:DUF1214 domain-containing protein [bacterium]MCP5044656.1 DUF1214 domain-containing protein [bacterium]
MSDASAMTPADARAWDEFCERLKAAGHQALDAAPENALDRAEGLRYVTRLARAFLRSTLEDADPALARLNTESPKIGLDNPDYIYASARLSSRFEYRLRATMGDAQLLGVGTYSGGLGTAKGLINDGYLSSSDLVLDADGCFEITISKQQRSGNWLAMIDATNQLTVRQTLLRRRSERPATLELRRIDAGGVPSPVDPERFVAGLGRAGLMVQGVVGQFLGWTRSFQEHPHEIRELDPALLNVAQGDPNTRYFYSYWQLAEDEALVIELVPPACEYWNLQIGNHWLESLDYLHYDTHVNHATVEKGDDGSVRIVVARSDPGVANWLDTAGHAQGGLALRFVGADEIPQVSTRVAKIEQLR